MNDQKKYRDQLIFDMKKYEQIIGPEEYIYTKFYEYFGDFIQELNRNEHIKPVVKTLLNGKVIEFYLDRSYAFIICNDLKKYYMHRKSLQKSNEWELIQNGAEVSFDEEMMPKGPSAKNVLLKRGRS